MQLSSADTESPQPLHSAARSSGQGAKRHKVQLQFNHFGDTTVTFRFADCSDPLFYSRHDALAGHGFSLFISSCSHTTKCTATRFPEAFRCTRPGRLWLAAFPSQG